jgi:hypothetical protein
MLGFPSIPEYMDWLIIFRSLKIVTNVNGTVVHSFDEWSFRHTLAIFLHCSSRHGCDGENRVVFTCRRQVHVDGLVSDYALHLEGFSIRHVLFVIFFAYRPTTDERQLAAALF